ncbi:NHLP family bacteriocin export ABC transporter peptidase/permease/ATPase subunit [Oscillospiraceae bacterium HV4-5-C5C]|nr:NHLP family bacteriocin export ABC transporter peptidase/permease/ATPase subunit [Oscillospiraceae bacterium HV4-5-C5C]
MINLPFRRPGAAVSQATGRRPVRPGHPAKVPVLLQMEALECGAACLAMVLAYYNKWLPLEQVRRDCGVSRDGTNAADIMRAARNYQLEVHAYRAEPEQLPQLPQLPCILHWNFNHFVVLDGFKKGRAVLNDPARGVVEVSMEELDQAFTGFLISLTPAAAFQPGGRPEPIRQYILSKLQDNLTAFIYVALSTFLAAMIGIISPAFSRVFMDQLLTQENPSWLTPLLLMMAGFAVIQVVLAWLEATYKLRLEGKTAIVANSRFVWHVLHLPVDFFYQRSVGDISSREAANEKIAFSLINTLAPLLFQSGVLVFYLFVMFRYSWLLSLIGISSLLIKALSARLIARKRNNILRVMHRDSAKLSSTTISGIEMIETLKASGAESGFFEQWAGYQAAVNTQQVRYARVNQFLGAVPLLVASLADITVLVLGSLMVMQGQFTIGMVLAFQGFLSSLAAPADQLTSAGQSLQETRTELERIKDVLDYPEDVREDTAYADEALTGKASSASGKLSGQIDISHLTFGYAPLGEPLIRDFSLSVAPGQWIALVGPSGCGKSTLAKLISGLYQPWSGEIRFDGQLAPQLPRAVLTGSLAVVDQDVTLFQDSIANNIRMWDSSIEDYEVILAARDASLHDDIMSREGGYAYVLSEGGRDLSGGQRQRMEIARVLAADPTIVILDEATSALDAQTEFEVVKAIRDRGITCLVIAHRLSTIRDCDEILVLDQGQVAERGKHSDLLARQGLYSRLVENDS